MDQKAKDDMYLSLRNSGLTQQQAEAATLAASAKLQEMRAAENAPPAAPVVPPAPVVEPTYEQLMSDNALLAATPPEVVLRIQNAAFAAQRAQPRVVEFH